LLSAVSKILYKLSVGFYLYGEFEQFIWFFQQDINKFSTGNC